MSRFDPARVRRDLAVPTVAEVIGVAAALFGVTAAEIVGYRRTIPLAHYRQAAMCAAHELTSAGYAGLARAFGRDAATIRYGCDQARTDGSAGEARASLVDELHRLAVTPMQSPDPPHLPPPAAEITPASSRSAPHGKERIIASTYDQEVM